MNTDVKDRLDLLKIARLERDGKPGELFEFLDTTYAQVDLEVPGHPDAVIWQTGHFTNDIEPVTHTLTDKFSLIGVLAALEILQLPSYLVPMMAQYRHDENLAPLAWFGAMPGVSIKWSTAGDFMVIGEDGERCVVAGKSGNAKLRTDAGVYCNVRSIEVTPGQWVRNVRAMPMLPYSQNKSLFEVDDDGIVRSFMQTPGVRLAYAARKFLQLVNDETKLKRKKALGRVATKPTQALEDGILAGLLVYLLGKTKMKVLKTYKVDPYLEHKESIQKILDLLPADFFDGFEQLDGKIMMHIADTNYGIMLEDFMDMVTPELNQGTITVLSTDLDGDRLTDLMADAPGVLIRFAEMVALNESGDTVVDKFALWKRLGFEAVTGMDMPSVMHRMDGSPIYEMTLGTADTMLDRVLDGNELVDELGHRKMPYDPMIHFSLTRDAMLAANPGHQRLRAYFEHVMNVLKTVYLPNERPTFIEGMRTLREKITPWSEFA